MSTFTISAVGQLLVGRVVGQKVAGAVEQQPLAERVHLARTQRIQLLAGAVAHNLLDNDREVLDEAHIQLVLDELARLTVLNDDEGLQSRQLEGQPRRRLVDESGLLEWQVLVRTFGGAVLKYGQLLEQIDQRLLLVDQFFARTGSRLFGGVESRAECWICCGQRWVIAV